MAFAVGAIAARWRRAFWTERSAERVWIPPTVWMLFLLISYHPAIGAGGEDRWHYFFWAGQRAMASMQTVDALPSAVSVAYALGPFLG